VTHEVSHSWMTVVGRSHLYLQPPAQMQTYFNPFLHYCKFIGSMKAAFVFGRGRIGSAGMWADHEQFQITVASCSGHVTMR
jgi:hypothetical protein